MSGDWSSGLCDCFEDMESCFITWFVPCYQIGLNKANTDGRDCSCCDCFVSMGGPHTAIYFNRTQIRAKYGLMQDPCNDCCVSAFCAACVVCQHARHIKANK